MSSAAHGSTPYYYVPHESRHPVMAAIGLFFVILGAGQWINGAEWGMYCLFFGMAWWLIVLYQWFSEAVHESETGMYGRKIDLSFRWSMTWFIFSEVMFFGAFFTALRWAAWKMLCSGLTSKRPGPAWSRVPPPRLRALWSRSRPWVLSGCPRSTRPCS